ncbi:hypothetical protein KFL_000220340 [Klebsormidium nitens]|uniref:Cytidyltransferase-like domain-containing protein n=1 Tax=Klebsormidium nitens TaxID=105231 RepID=A0A1Y1HLY0_KLENI|nr:hypothetical protein KFL_000220340 [Klebsormidium nitens]|eukprot:GAQ79003.1 hypothetical protein KFL_000220340 [Klebsormidium nitens]
MDPGIEALVQAIHATPMRAMLLFSGGASQALSWLLSVPGASSTLLEATTPYSRRALHLALGKEPEQFASQATANDMALKAYNRALMLAGPGVPVAGIGCTCAIVSGAPKRGDHRCFVAARTQERTWEAGMFLDKGLRDRLGEDDVTSRLLLQAIANASGVPRHLDLRLTDSEAQRLQWSTRSFSRDEQLEQLLRREVPFVTFLPEGLSLEGKRRVILPGSFNPLHEGHLGMMDAACKLVRNPAPCFELSATNPDKPALPVDEIRRRAKQFEDRGSMLVVTDASLFTRKAQLLPDSTFVVGVDTAKRLFMKKYYDDSRANMIRELSQMRENGCDFAVAGRALGENGFERLEDIEVPHEVADIFKAIPDFRMDISSTELRKKLQNAAPKG